jgi:regulator of nucleoside diphosphate kinase
MESDMETNITLTKTDVARLRTLLRKEHGAAFADRANLLELQDEVERALIVDAPELPDDAVALDRRILIRDAETTRCEVYTLVCRASADISAGELSVLAPLGIAVLGCRSGDEVEWITPGGRRRLVIEAVEKQREWPEDPQPPSHERRAA